jgi:hypothetical protein
MLNLAISISPGIEGRVSQGLYWVYALMPLIPQNVGKLSVGVLATRTSFDAEVVELRLPEDKRIQVQSAEDLEAIGRKVPILHEIAYVHPYPEGSKPIANESHVLAEYDGPWVCYCELRDEETATKGPAQ